MNKGINISKKEQVLKMYTIPSNFHRFPRTWSSAYLCTLQPLRKLVSAFSNRWKEILHRQPWFVQFEFWYSLVDGNLIINTKTNNYHVIKVQMFLIKVQRDTNYSSKWSYWWGTPGSWPCARALTDWVAKAPMLPWKVGIIKVRMNTGWSRWG